MVTIDLSAPATRRLVLRAGCKAILRVRLTRDGEPVDLTEAKAWYKAETTPAIDKSVDNGGIILDIPGSALLIVFEEDDTKGATTHTARHECALQLAGEGRVPVFDGLLVVKESILD